MKTDARALGAWGEKKASGYLRRRGYRIVSRNFRCRSGEIDLIAEKRGFLVFVEVKMRKDDAHGSAKAFVDGPKQHRLLSAARYYLSRYPTELQPRFDVVEIYAPHGVRTFLPKISHLEDAFS